MRKERQCPKRFKRRSSGCLENRRSTAIGLSSVSVIATSLCSCRPSSTRCFGSQRCETLQHSGSHSASGNRLRGSAVPAWFQIIRHHAYAPHTPPSILRWTRFCGRPSWRSHHPLIRQRRLPSNQAHTIQGLNNLQRHVLHPLSSPPSSVACPYR